MSKKKRDMERVKKEKAKQKKRNAKAKRQHNDPAKWNEKKRKKQSAQKAVWDSKYPYANKDCPLILSKFPSPENCKDCNFRCYYNPN